MPDKKKVIVYIDAANIILSCQNINLQINVIKLIQKLKDKFRTDNIIYFTGDFKSLRTYFNELEKVGVELVLKEIYNESNKIKANCDVEMAHRITFDVENKLVDEVILLSGDGDFAHLTDYIYKNNCRVRVIAAEPISCSRMIKKRQFIILSYLKEFGKEILINEGEQSDIFGFPKTIVISNKK